MTAAEGAALAPWQRIRQEIDLPTPTALWVLSVHLLTILSPLLLIAVVADRDEYLGTVLDRPWMLYVAAGCFIAGSIAESAQNTLDRWYLIGTPPSLLDLLFNKLIVIGLAAQILAVSASPWAWLSLVAVIGYVMAYGMGWPTAPWQAVLGIVAAALLWRALDQPVVFLSLVAVFLTLYFLDVLVRTRQQVLHGFTTGVNIINVVALSLAILWASDGTGWTWPVIIATAVITVVIALAVRPRLLRLPPTPHQPFATVRSSEAVAQPVTAADS